MGRGGQLPRKAIPNLRIVDDVVDPTRQEVASDRLRPLPPVMPDDLHSDLRALWDMIVADLDDAGLIARVDGLALHLALEHYRVAIDAAQMLGADGPTATGSQGQDVPHPASQVFAKHSEAFTTLAKQLGLTFVARARTAVPDNRTEEQKGNPFGGSAG